MTRLVSRLVALALPWAASVGFADGGPARTIELDAVVASDAATVFRLFTTSDGVESLFPGATARIEPEVGGEYRVAFDPAHPDGDVNGTAGARILALEPGRHLAVQWTGPAWAPQMNVEPLPTWVEVDFEPLGRAGCERCATRVRLRHRGFAREPSWDRAYAFFTRGWGGMLARLEARFAGR